MRTVITTALSLLAAASLSLAACGPTTADSAERDGLRPQPGELAGDWASACVDPGNGQGFRLSFALTEDTWELAYDAFGDAACAVPFLTVNIAGPYTLGEPSESVPKAREGEFGFASKAVTPHNDAAVGFLQQACGREDFSVGQASDLGAGCAGLGAYPIAQCPSDHDLVFLSGDKLQFGQRPMDNNMCSPDKRPTALGVDLSRQ